MKLFFQYLKFLLSLAGVSFLITFILRAATFFSNFSLLSDEGSSSCLLWLGAFLRGVRFDSVVVCYVLVIPLVCCFIASLCKCAKRWLVRAVTIYLCVLFSLVFAVNAANISYFGYFFRNINSSIFQWTEEAGNTLGMIVSESSYIVTIVLGFVVIIAFWIIAFRLEKRLLRAVKNCGTDNYLLTSVVGVLLILLCVLGIRGRVGYHSIRVSEAYFCNDPFLNQLGVSPSFNLIVSIIESNKATNKRLSLMDSNEAVEIMKSYFNVSADSSGNAMSPLMRHIASDTSVLSSPNVVLVLMESMSAELLGEFGNDKGMTPFLDSLSRNSIFFTNLYSAGNHTNQGIFSTLYSYPTVMFRNIMKNPVVSVFDGIPTVLKSYGYNTYFYMTHERQYDNMNAFLRTNGYENIRSQEDYPSSAVVNNYGVNDAFLFDYALKELLATGDSIPFFATLLTICNHPPYCVPSDFKRRNEENEWAIVEFADKCLRDFFESYKKSPKFKNTVFIFVADHGKIVGTPECEIPLSYNHVPMMIYFDGCEPRRVSSLASQCDVMPTLLGLLGMEYDYSGFGKNLLKETRSEIAFSTDNSLVAADTSHLYIYVPSSKEEYVYLTKNNKPIEKTSADSVKELKQFLFSTFQAVEAITIK